MYTQFQMVFDSCWDRSREIQTKSAEFNANKIRRNGVETKYTRLARVLYGRRRILYIIMNSKTVYILCDLERKIKTPNRWNNSIGCR